MVAVIVMSRHSPPKLRSALRSRITTIGTDYQKLQNIVADFLTIVLEYTSAAVVSETRVTSATMSVCRWTSVESRRPGKGRLREQREVQDRNQKFSNECPRSLIHVRNLETRACQRSAETRQCIHFSWDTIITASSVRYQ